MLSDSRYDILFEPVQIGPVTSKNRFYQVPHCNGTGDSSPRVLAGMRQVKAQGGWGVVCTENLMVHTDSDIAPFQAVRLWDDKDIPAQQLMVESVHKYGALAGCELTHFGIAASNRNTREVPVGPSSRMTMEAIDPRQSRRMSKSDIKQFRARHRNAALRAKQAGFDIIYVYCSLENSILAQFFSSAINDRSDEYGGNFSNRTRLFRELLSDTLDAVGDRCAVAVRMPVAQFTEAKILENSQLRDIIESQANVPDLWDVNVNDWAYDSATSRFGPEAHQQTYVSFVKTVSDKPVVGVGRFTSPQTMVTQVKKGIIDFIGAARPSIADPFLPEKIKQGREDEIRECIGCNICVSGENSFSIMRCTQNPTIMEEWRRGWHPETVIADAQDRSVLIIGAGPAGLESALTLGRRGYDVVLAEALSEFGGRVVDESRLPGLSEWIRVRDYRLGQLEKMNNVQMYLDSKMDVTNVFEVGAKRIVCANGARWRADGVGRQHYTALVNPGTAGLITPEQVMRGDKIDGPVIVYDDDGGYLSSAIAEKLILEGKQVEIITPHLSFARFTALTLEQDRLIKRMLHLGVSLQSEKALLSYRNHIASFKCVHSDSQFEIEAACLVMITSRQPNDELYLALQKQIESHQALAQIQLHSIGDCNAPGLIADAVFAGHRLARQMDVDQNGVECKREYII